MKLALDFDGTLSDTIQSWVHEYNKAYYKDTSKPIITHRDIDQWAFYKNLNISLEECFVYFSRAWNNWEGLRPLEPHLEQKTKMLNNMIDVDIVTAVSSPYIPNIEKWLKYHEIHYGKIVRSLEKEKLDYDIYIDDSSRNIQNVFDAGKIGLLYNQPWNRELFNRINIPSKTKPINYSKIKRVYNMYNAIDVVRELVT